MAFLDSAGLSYYDSKLKDSINDYTTGINLIRGTSDFRIGNILKNGITLNNNSGYADGFYLRNSGSKIMTDEDIPYIRLSNSSAEIDVNSSIVTNIKPSENLTVSVDVRLSDISSNMLNAARVMIGVVTKGSTTRKYSYSSSMTEIKDVISEGEWIRFSKMITLPMDITEDDYVVVVLYRLATNPIEETVDFRALKLEKGNINHPIWSPSPFDVDYINDETTGINLLRGTRDFVKGTIRGTVLPTWNFINGFVLGNYATVDTSGEFGVLTIERSGLSGATNTDVVSSVIEDVTAGDILTLSLEVRVNDDRVLSNTNFTCAALRTLVGTSGGVVSQTAAKNITLTSLADTIELGEWYKVETQLKVPENSDVANVLLRLSNNGSISFRKLCVCNGAINNLIWAPSPSDVAQITDLATKADKSEVEAINDFTTGINLLRGTRDFTEGKTLIPGNTSSLKSDGISYSNTNWRIIHPDNPNEFSYAERLLTGQASHLYFNPIYKEDIGNNGLTMSAEIMFEAVPSGDVSIFQILPQDKGSGGSYTSIYGGVNNSTDYTIDTMPLNEWFRIVLHIEQDKINIPDGGYLRIGLVGGSGNDATRYIRKVKLEPGIINNPVYSESPFDHPSIPVPINQGGTGAITSKAAQYNLLNDMILENTVMEDGSQFIMRYKSPSTTGGLAYIRNASNVWDWIKSKIKSVFGFNDSDVLSIEHGGTGGTTYKEAAYNLFSDIPNVSNMSGDRQFVVQHGSKSATAGAFARVKGNDIWDWIKSKIEADGSLGGGGLKYHEFTDTDFNKITEDGLYYIPRQYMKAKGLPKINVLSGNYEGGEGWVLAIDLFRDSTSNTVNYAGTRLTKFLCIGYFEGGDEDDDSGSFYSTYGTYLWEAGTYYYGGIKGAIKLSSLSTIQINN